eukprot:510774_1
MDIIYKLESLINCLKDDPVQDLKIILLQDIFQNSSMRPRQYHQIINLFILGNRSVTSNILNAFVAADRWHIDPELFGARQDYYVKIVHVRNKKIKLVMHQFTGKDNDPIDIWWRIMIQSGSPRGIIFAYDVTRKETFHTICESLKQNHVLATTNHLIKMIIGNKHMESSRQISLIKATQFARKHDMIYFETCIKTNPMDIQNVFYSLVESILDAECLIIDITHNSKTGSNIYCGILLLFYYCVLFTNNWIDISHKIMSNETKTFKTFKGVVTNKKYCLYTYEITYEFPIVMESCLLDMINGYIKQYDQQQTHHYRMIPKSIYNLILLYYGCKLHRQEYICKKMVSKRVFDFVSIGSNIAILAYSDDICYNILKKEKNNKIWLISSIIFDKYVTKYIQWC